MIRYLLDEHVPRSLRRALRREDPALIVWPIGRPYTPALGTPDPGILVWCERNDFIIVTNNRRTMPVHLAEHLAQGHHVPGIFIIDPDATIPQTVGDLVLVAGASFHNEYQDSIRYLPIGGSR